MREIRVLMTELFLPESTYTAELAKELRKRVRLTIFCRRGAALPLRGVRWIDRFYAGGDPNKLRGALAYLAGLASLRITVKKGHFDVLHVQTFKRDRIEIPLYEQLRREKKVRLLVHTVHNLLPHEAGERDRALYRGFYQACDLLVVHNRFCRDLLMRDYGIPAEKIVVTPHGHYTLDGTPQWTAKGERTGTGTKATDGCAGTEERGGHTGSTDGRTEFVQFGLFRHYKGIDLLLRAIARIPEKERQTMHWTIAGKQFTDLDPTNYRQMAGELGIGDCVTLHTDHVPQEDLPRLFGDADFALFPYREIYGSGALLMAMTYGKPPIASDIPAFVEETENGETGLLFASEQIDALAEAMRQAAAMPAEDYARRQRLIRTLLQEKYSWRVSAGILADAWESALRKK